VIHGRARELPHASDELGVRDWPALEPAMAARGAASTSAAGEVNSGAGFEGNAELGQTTSQPYLVVNHQAEWRAERAPRE